MLRHKGLKQPVNLLQVFFEFCATLVGILAQHGQGALMLAGCNDLYIHVGFFKRTMEIRYLSDYANATNG